MEAGADVCMHSFEVEVEVVNDMFFYSGRTGLSDHVVLYIVHACNVPRTTTNPSNNTRANDFHTENEVPSSLQKKKRLQPGVHVSSMSKTLVLRAVH